MRNISVKVNTIWNGQVAIRNKYVDRAIKGQSDLAITHDNITMVIPCDEVESKIRGKRENVPDKFSDKLHTLYYFSWDIGVRPDEIIKKEIESKQDKLL